MTTPKFDTLTRKWDCDGCNSNSYVIRYYESQLQKWKRRAVYGFLGWLFFLVFMAGTVLAQEEKKTWVGVEPAKEETIQPRSNFDDSRMILAFMLDRCWALYAKPISAGPNMKYTVPRAQEPPVDQVLSCVEAELIEHRTQMYGIGQPDENEIKKAKETPQ